MLGDERAISLLEEYVKCAEPDARKLPEACYRLAVSHGLKGPKHMGSAKKFYAQGERADQHQVALGLFPEEAAQFRKQARALVNHYHSCEREDCKSSATKNCSGCGRVYYCSKECQVADWPAHEGQCKLFQGKITCQEFVNQLAQKHTLENEQQSTGCIKNNNKTSRMLRTSRQNDLRVKSESLFAS